MQTGRKCLCFCVYRGTGRDREDVVVAPCRVVAVVARVPLRVGLEENARIRMVFMQCQVAVAEAQEVCLLPPHCVHS